VRKYVCRPASWMGIEPRLIDMLVQIAGRVTEAVPYTQSSRVGLMMVPSGLGSVPSSVKTLGFTSS
jgi:hypothetical protein